MKKFVFTLAICFLASLTYAQSVHDERLLEKYSVELLDELKMNNPTEYTILNNALKRGIFIGEIPTEKGKSVVFDGELEIDPKATHTFISLGIELKENEYQYFKIKGTNQLVGVLPKSLLK